MIWSNNTIVVKIERKKWDEKIGKVLASDIIDKSGDTILEYIMTFDKRCHHMNRKIKGLEEENRILKGRNRKLERYERKYLKKSKTLNRARKRVKRLELELEELKVDIREENRSIGEEVIKSREIISQQNKNLNIKSHFLMFRIGFL